MAGKRAGVSQLRKSTHAGRRPGCLAAHELVRGRDLGVSCARSIQSVVLRLHIEGYGTDRGRTA
jgi:hypothetical protein